MPIINLKLFECNNNIILIINKIETKNKYKGKIIY